MKASDAVAPRRHRKQAARWPPEHETRNRRFYLKLADQWLKIEDGHIIGNL